MKSNEEFIAGIYEKAAVYTEEKEIKIRKVSRVEKAARIAAMAVVCIGLAGALVFGGVQNQENTPEPASEEYGIALLSDASENEAGAAMQFRRTPVAETVTFSGVVEQVDEEEKRIWLSLEFEETAPEQTEGSMVCIRWDMLEEMDKEITEGVKLTATGILSVYDNEDSEYHGCAELVLTDKADFLVK